MSNASYLAVPISNVVRCRERKCKSKKYLQINCRENKMFRIGNREGINKGFTCDVKEGNSTQAGSKIERNSSFRTGEFRTIRVRISGQQEFSLSFSQIGTLDQLPKIIVLQLLSRSAVSVSFLLFVTHQKLVNKYCHIQAFVPVSTTHYYFRITRIGS